MQETRRQRLQTVILEELSTVVPREVKDPRVPPLTFTSVQVTPDGSHAVVFVSLFGLSSAPNAFGDATEEEVEKARKLARERMKGCLEGLTSATGFLRKHLARALTVRHVPTLAFREDRGFDNTLRVNELLKQIKNG